SAHEQRLERRDLLRLAGDDDLARAGVWYTVGCAELVQASPSVETQRGLQRAGRVIDPGVNHAAVVRARVEPGSRMPLQYARRQPSRGNRPCRCETRDTRPDHRNVN